jgi:hypothetical protein
MQEKLIVMEQIMPVYSLVRNFGQFLGVVDGESLWSRQKKLSREELGDECGVPAHVDTPPHLAS